jgi:hypothetical protein
MVERDITGLRLKDKFRRGLSRLLLLRLLRSQGGQAQQ